MPVKKHLVALCVLFFFAVIFCCGGRAAAAEAELAHAIFVKVNGETITKEQVMEAVNFIVRREFSGKMPGDPQMLENLQDAALRDLVRTYLIYDEARRSGISIGTEYSKRAERTSNMKPEEITPTIRKMLIADDIFEDMMMQLGTPVRQPSPRDIKEFYTKNRKEFRSEDRICIRTIFLAKDPRRPLSVLQSKADEIVREVSANPMPRRTTSFANQARQFSEDVFGQFGGLLTGNSPERMIPREFNNKSPENGGDIFPPKMYEAIQELKRPGEMRVAESDDGLHIVYLESQEIGRDMPWPEAKRIIEYILGERAKNQRLRSWLNRVYDRSDVRWHDGTVYPKEELTRILLPSERTPQPS